MAHTLPWLATQHSLVLLEFLILPPHPSPPGPCLCMLPDFLFSLLSTFIPESTTSISPQTQDLSTEFQPHISMQSRMPLNSQGLHRLPRLLGWQACLLRCSLTKPHRVIFFTMPSLPRTPPGFTFEIQVLLSTVGGPKGSRMAPGIWVSYMECTGCSYHLCLTPVHFRSFLDL